MNFLLQQQKNIQQQTKTLLPDVFSLINSQGQDKKRRGKTREKNRQGIFYSNLQYKTKLHYYMGNTCDCLLMFHGLLSNKNPQSPEPPISTNRRMITSIQLQQHLSEHNNLQQPKRIQHSNISISESFQADAKQLNSKKSTSLTSNICNRKISSIIQSYVDTSSIIIINPKSTINPTQIDSSEYYTLIDKVVFVKKTSDRLKIMTPAGSSQLNCPPQNMMPTLFIAEGIPLETLPQDIYSSEQKSFVQAGDSPVRLVLKLNCLQCKKKVKLTYCKAYVSIQKLKCSKCQEIGKWGLLDIEANASIWGEGRRILDHESFEPASTEFRLLGCVMCFKFSDLRKIQSCDCYVCKNCQIPGQEIVCPICNPFNN